MRKFLYNYTANKPCRLISRDGNPYLERYFLGKKWGRTFYLHRFVSGDGDKEVHDHPWDCVAIPLVGSYIEERVVGLSPIHGWVSEERKIKPGQINKIRCSDFHRIVSTERDTWTLFMHKNPVIVNGLKRKGWGFLKETDEGVVYHQPYKMTNGSPWWDDAALGKDIGRESLK